MIRLYQDIAVSWLLNQSSWEYLLSVLLHHTWTLLTNRDTTLACALANSILKVPTCLPSITLTCAGHSGVCNGLSLPALSM